MHCFVINLDRVPERWAFAKAEFEKVGLAAERFPAVDARRLEDYRDVKYVPHTGGRWEMQKSAIAVFESHRRLWQTIIDRDLEMAAIFEDDMFLLPEIVELFDLIETEQPPFEFLKLDDAFYPVRLSAPEFKIQNRRARRILSVSTSTGAYVITRRGAEQLLRLSASYCDNADDFIFAPRPGWSALQLEPVVTSQMMALPRDFADAYANAEPVITKSERIYDPQVKQKLPRGPLLYRLRKEIRRSARRFYWWAYGDRALLAKGGIKSRCRLSPDQLPGGNERNLPADRLG